MRKRKQKLKPMKTGAKTQSITEPEENYFKFLYAIQRIVFIALLVKPWGMYEVAKGYYKKMRILHFRGMS